MKKFLSYIFPFTKKIISPFNGTLELNYTNGKKVLDSANANYSYGSLQRVLKYALQHTDLTGVKTVLLLGLGGGSVIETLLTEFKYTGSITAVDIDPVIIELAKNEFGIQEDNELKVICSDARTYLESTNEKFDLIIVDLFIDNRIPTPFFNLEFWKLLQKASDKKGKIIFNTIEETSSEMEVIKNYMKENFELKLLKKVEETNTVYIWNAK